MMFPVDPATFGAFLLTVSAIVLSPGPDTLIILRYTLSSGTRTGLITVAGVQTGLLVHTTLAVLGISVIIASSPVLFKGVAVLGALYIAWLGFQGFREGGLLDVNNGGKSGVSGRKAYLDAILCNVLNPKVILIFLALFPNFVETDRGNVTGQLLTLALGLIIMNTLWQVPLALAAEVVRRWLLNPTAYKIVTRSTGVLLIAIALMMVYENLLK
ncbi:MAG: LysE family translocator [Rhodospirillaceae bacterium]|nr:LysE family translocator [Rhodospirillaceae bacterium]